MIVAKKVTNLSVLFIAFSSTSNKQRKKNDESSDLRFPLMK
jgi:hypothetical protein